MYSVLVRYPLILGSQNVDFLAAWAEITNHPKSKQKNIPQTGFYVPQGILCTITAWLAPKKSNINKYLTSRQFYVKCPFQILNMMTHCYKAFIFRLLD